MPNKGQSKIEPGVTPQEAVVLRWRTFTEAAEQAGMSRRYGGIHFEAADKAGRLLGVAVAAEVWSVCNGYFTGHVTYPKLLQGLSSK